MNTSPMFIKDGKMYVNNMSFIMKKDQNDVLTQQDLVDNSYEINGVLLSGISDMANSALDEITNNQEQIANAIDTVTTVVGMVDDVQVHYYLNNEYVYENEVADIYTPSYTDQTIILKLIAQRDMNEGDEIHILLPGDIGSFTAIARGDPNSRDIDVENIDFFLLLTCL